MAYLELHLAPATGSAAERLLQTRPAPEVMLSAVERQVLRLARGDVVASIRPVNVVDRVLKAVFGLRRPTSLADPRLEALRRLAVVARCRSARRVTREMSRFLALGYTPEQAAAVLSLAASS